MVTSIWPKLTGLVVGLALSSCSGGDHWIPIGPLGRPQRSVSIQGYPVTGFWSRNGYLTDRAPLTIAVTAGAGAGWEDEDAQRYWPEAITNLEIDFGDGSGWISYAGKWQAWYWDSRNVIEKDKMAQHTYTKPGTYYVTARATYWDGTVLYSDANERIGVSVFALGLPLPPAL